MLLQLDSSYLKNFPCSWIPATSKISSATGFQLLEHSNLSCSWIPLYTGVANIYMKVNVIVMKQTHLTISTPYRLYQPGPIQSQEAKKI